MPITIEQHIGTSRRHIPAPPHRIIHAAAIPSPHRHKTPPPYRQSYRSRTHINPTALASALHPTGTEQNGAPHDTLIRHATHPRPSTRSYDTPPPISTTLHTSHLAIRPLRLAARHAHRPAARNAPTPPHRHSPNQPHQRYDTPHTTATAQRHERKQTHASHKEPTKTARPTNRPPDTPKRNKRNEETDRKTGRKAKRENGTKNETKSRAGKRPEKRNGWRNEERAEKRNGWQNERQNERRVEAIHITDTKKTTRKTHHNPATPTPRQK